MARPVLATAENAAAVPAARPRAVRYWAPALLVVLAGAAILRFAGLPQQGFAYWDEAKFALEGVRLHAEILHLLLGHGAADAGKAVGTAKPAHALLIALAYTLFGVHDYAALYLSAAAGVTEVGLVFLIGRRLFSPGTGLVAALLLAVAPYDIIYSRSALSETDANAVFLVGVLGWSYTWLATDSGRGARPARSLVLLAAAIICGLSFTVNYRMVTYIAVLVIVDVCWALLRDPKSVLARLAAWVAGLVLAPAAWQIASVYAAQRHSPLFRNEVTLHAQTYLDQVLGRFNLALSPTQSLSTLPLQWLLQRQGWLVIVLLLVSLAVAAAVRSLPWTATAALVVVPTAASMASSLVVARTVEGAIPFAVLLIAAAIARFMTVGFAPRLVAVAVTIALVFLGAANSWQMTAQRSGFVRAVQYLNRHGARGALTSSEVIAFYYRGPGSHCRAPRPSSLDHLAADVSLYHYAVLDYHAGGVVNRILRDHGVLVARYPVLSNSSLGAELIASEAAARPSVASARYLDVYRTDTIHIESPHPAPADVCRLGRAG